MKQDEEAMEDWDLETVEKVVESKKTEYNQTNGGKECHYRPAMPPGCVLKSQMKALLNEEA